LLIFTFLILSVRKTFKKEFQALFDSEANKYAAPSEDLINISLIHLLEIKAKGAGKIQNNFLFVCFLVKLQFKTRISFQLTEVGQDTRKLLKEYQINIGKKYFEVLFNEYRDALCSIAGTLQSFFNNLNSLDEALSNHKEFSSRFFYLPQKHTSCLPNFRCEDEVVKKLNKKPTHMLKMFTIQEKTTPFMSNFYLGLIENAAKLLLNLDIKVEKFKKSDLALGFMKFDLINTESTVDMEFIQHVLGFVNIFINYCLS